MNEGSVNNERLEAYPRVRIRTVDGGSTFLKLPLRMKQLCAARCKDVMRSRKESLALIVRQVAMGHT